MSSIGQITILLVDNQTQTLDIHASLLHEMGYFNHLMAESGAEALAMINNFAPDMLIISQATPDINWLTLLRLVRNNDTAEKETTFILYGNKLTDHQFAQAGRAGVNQLINKPFNSKMFKNKIIEALNPPRKPADEKAESLYTLSMVQLEQGQLNEALSTCRSILDIHDNAEVYYNMGYIKSLIGDFEEALDCFRRAITINAYHAKAYRQMGLICQKMGLNKDAQQYLETAAELHMDRNQDNEAEEIFNVVLTLRPNTTNVYNSLGIIYRRQGRLKEALEAYDKALKVHPEDEYILFNMARVHLDLSDQVAARECLHKVLKMAPDFTVASELLRATELGIKITI